MGTKKLSKIKNESGIALITALLIMVLITVLGTAAIMTSTTDVKIGANFRDYTKSFYAADGAVNIGAGVIDRAFVILDLEGNTFTLQSDIDLTSAGDLMTELGSGNEVDPSDAALLMDETDISTTVGDSNVNIDVDYTGPCRNAICLSGLSTESQSRYEGIGAGGSVITSQYRIHSVASNNTGSSQVKVQTLYLRVQK